MTERLNYGRTNMCVSFAFHPQDAAIFAESRDVHLLQLQPNSDVRVWQDIAESALATQLQM